MTKLQQFLETVKTTGEHLVDEEGLKMSIMLKIAPKEYMYMFLAGVGAIIIGHLTVDQIRKLYK